MKQSDSPSLGRPVENAAAAATSGYRVTDPAQARLLTDPVARDFLGPFLGRTASVAEAAAELGAAQNTTLYRVRTLLRAGLLRQVGERRRAGRPIKLYRSSHDHYFVPFAATGYDTLEDRLRAQGRPIWDGLIDAYAAALHGHRRYGHHVFRSGGAVMTSDLLPEQSPSGRPLFWSDTTVTLTDADADELAARLREWYAELVRRSPASTTGGSGEKGRRYLALAALLPVPPQR